ncbi:hypothetical protein DU972_003782 [Vibrio mimicus]
MRKIVTFALTAILIQPATAAQKARKMSEHEIIVLQCEGEDSRGFKTKSTFTITEERITESILYPDDLQNKTVTPINVGWIGDRNSTFYANNHYIRNVYQLTQWSLAAKKDGNFDVSLYISQAKIQGDKVPTAAVVGAESRYFNCITVN